MVVPTKGIVGKDNYATMIRSVENLIKQFSVLNGSSHIAIVQFAKKAKVRFDISDLSSPNRLKNVIKAMRNNNENLGKKMHTYNALKVVSRKVFKDGRGERAGTVNVIILFTHKPADDYQADVIEELEVSKECFLYCKIENKIKSVMQLIIGGHPLPRWCWWV